MLKELQIEIEKHSIKEQWSILKQIKNRERNKARSKVNRLFERKNPKIDKQCQICKSKKNIEFHHIDYNQPYVVNMLCKKCHTKLHNDLIEKPKPIDLEEYCEPIKKHNMQKVEYKRQWLKDLWLEQGYKNSTEVATKCNISSTYIEQIARAGVIPSIKVAKKIAEVLSFDYRKLMEKPISQSKIEQLKNIINSEQEFKEVLNLLTERRE